MRTKTTHWTNGNSAMRMFARAGRVLIDTVALVGLALAIAAIAVVLGWLDVSSLVSRV